MTDQIRDQRTELLIEQMIENLKEVKKEAIKFGRGNDAAGTRVRKSMQEVKALAQIIRQHITDVKAER